MLAYDDNELYGSTSASISTVVPRSVSTLLRDGHQASRIQRQGAKPKANERNDIRVTDRMESSRLTHHLGRGKEVRLMVSALFAVLSSIRPLSGTEVNSPILHSAEAENAAKEIGRELATAGFSIAVYSSNQAYLDQHIVSGFFSVNKPRGGQVHIWHTQGSAIAQFKELDDPRFEGRFVSHTESTDNWNTIFFQSMKQVDGVVMLGGSDFCLVAALWALDTKKSLATVAHFGGGARAAWVVMQSEKGFASEKGIEAMGAKWSAHSARRIVESLKDQRNVQRKAVKGPRTKALVVTSLLVAVTAIVFISSLIAVAPGSHPFYLMVFVGPLFAGMAGAMLRKIWGDRPGTSQRSVGTTCALGFGAGFAYLLLVVISQASANQSFLDPHVPLSPVSAVILSATSIAVAFGAGFVLDNSLTKMKKDGLVAGPDVELMASRDRLNDSNEGK